MKDDLISRQKAISVVSYWLEDLDDDREIDEVIESIPPEAPRIVLCKDCGYLKKYKDGGIWCEQTNVVVRVEDGGFCKWGKI